MKKTRKDNIRQYFGDVWSVIPTDRYRTAYDIAEELGINHSTVRRVVKDIRQNGLPIVTDLHYGYKKASTDTEIWLCIRELEDRVSALQDTISTLKRMTKGEEQ